ncbi:MAG: PAS domain S-box protein [Promethearchaeota archaeon]|nr:MAG: PAS domain S-box protein [Candidatus Lokiarchaeota archaeon]
MNLDEKFKQIFKGILIPAYIWQKKENKLVLIDYNNAAEENIYRQIEDYIGVGAEEFYKDQTIVLENLNRCLNEQKGFISEIEITQKFLGEKKFILFKFDFIQPDLVIVYENDITYCILKSLELEKSEKKYNSLISYMTDVVWTKDHEGNAIHISPNVVNILGFTPEEVIHGESEYIWFSRIHPDDVKKIKEAYLALFEKNIRFDVEYRIKKKDGEWIWLRDIADIIYEKDGVKYTDGVFFDITERKLAESKLRETEEKYKALVFNIPSVTWTTDYEGHTTFISPNIEKIYGFSPEEIYSGDEDEVWFGRIHPEDADRVRESYAALFEKNEVYDIEYRIKRKDEKWIWLHDTANITYEKNGVLFADGVLSDVTDRKIAEIALKESEEKYRLLFKNMVAGFSHHRVVFNEYHKPIDYIFLEVNDAFEELTGLKKENIINRKISEVMPDIMKSEFDWIGIYGELSKKGGEKRFEQYASPLDRWYSVVAYSSERGYFSTIFVDITERKKLIKELKESEERYRLITENVNDLILVINEENILEYVNEKVFRNILGFSKEDLIGKSIIENIHPDDVNKCLAAIKKGIFEGNTSVKLHVSDKNGNYHMIEFIGGWFKDIHDLRKGFIVGREISEKKPSELKLEES